MPSQEAFDHVDRITRESIHAAQVKDGLIPADSPPDFVRPEGEAAVGENGLPSWFGPNYKPTSEAIKAFAEPASPPSK
jgi:hypothetical protein